MATRQGVTPVFPGGSIADSLFGRLGSALVLEHEDHLVGASVASATVATHLAFVGTASRWLSDHGMPPEHADRYIASIFAGVGDELRHTARIDAVVASHATPGGLNERLEQTVRDAGLFSVLVEALDGLLDDLGAQRT